MGDRKNASDVQGELLVWQVDFRSFGDLTVALLGLDHSKLVLPMFNAVFPWDRLFKPEDEQAVRAAANWTADALMLEIARLTTKVQ
jgi:hypothetical protein